MSAAKFSAPVCVVAPAGAGAALARRTRRSPAAAGLTIAGVTASGRRSAPVEIVIWPSASMRTASSAPTRLTRLACRLPIRRPVVGDRDFGLGRAGDHRAVGVADQHVADAKRHAAGIVALDLRAADLDLVTAAERLLDRGGKERRGDVDRDRAGREPRPQTARADGHDRNARCRRPEAYGAQTAPAQAGAESRARSCAGATARSARVQCCWNVDSRACSAAMRVDCLLSFMPGRTSPCPARVARQNGRA